MRLLSLVLWIFSLNISASTNQWEGIPFPDFSLKDQDGVIKSKKDFKADWKVYYFYPKDKTPGCTIEAQNFTDDYKKFQRFNAQVIGISYDDVESHKDFADTYQLPFTLLADTDAILSKKLKVNKIFPWPHASRQTFIVNRDNIIVKHYKEVSPKTHSRSVLKYLGAQMSKNHVL